MKNKLLFVGLLISMALFGGVALAEVDPASERDKVYPLFTQSEADTMVNALQGSLSLTDQQAVNIKKLMLAQERSLTVSSDTQRALLEDEIKTLLTIKQKALLEKQIEMMKNGRK